jgi:DNA-binding response OmpR family regulator
MMSLDTRSTRQPDVLFIEDSEQDAELPLRVLQRHESARSVVWVRDGVEAIDDVFGAADQPALMAHPRSRHIPVVIMSSSRVDHDISESLGDGANSYVVKPVNFDDFSETVRQISECWLTVNETAGAR